MDTSLSLGSVTLPTALVIVSTLIFLALERVFPGRTLPHSKGWYTRAILVNLAQLALRFPRRCGGEADADARLQGCLLRRGR